MLKCTLLSYETWNKTQVSAATGSTEVHIFYLMEFLRSTNCKILFDLTINWPKIALNVTFMS